MSVRRAFAVGLLPVAMIMLANCRTSGRSEAKELPSVEEVGKMSLAEFTAACQNLQNSTNTQDREAVNVILQHYAKTTDCATAYPVLAALIAKKPV